MNVTKLLHTADEISTWIGKAASWLIVTLMLMVCIEVFKRYLLNMPTGWIYDASNKKCVLKTSMNDKALYQQGHDYALAGYYTDALDALDAIRDKHGREALKRGRLFTK